MPYQRLINISFIAFSVFLLVLIAMANTGQRSLFFDLAYAVPYGDKVSHIVLFGLLTAGSIAYTNFKRFKLGRWRIYRGTLYTSLFVILEELSQAFIPARTLDGGDLLADTIGIGLFTLLTVGLHREFIRRTRQALIPYGDGAL